MSRLDELPPDQRAALSLLLRKQTYAQVAALVGIGEQAVHDRAHAGLAVLAPLQARGLSAERRQEIGDYLLSQQPGVAERMRTRTYLASAEPARSWAEAVSAQLAPLASGGLPEIPPPAPAPAPARAQPDPPAASIPPPQDLGSAPARSSSPTEPSSRLGGALLLAALVVAVAVAVILILTSGGGGSHAKTAARTSSAPSAKSGPAKGPALPLHSPNPTSRTVGVVEVLSEGGKSAFYIDAEHLPETRNFFYAIWLYNSPTSAEALSKSPAVGSSHKLAGGALLPTNAGQFHEILVTRETQPHPTTPGKIVLRGAFNISA
jgi:hypothetical protein